jgi:Rap/ran-GAP.
MKTLKFGVLFQDQGQGSDEDQMYNNTTISCPEYEELLELLGTKVPLAGWKKYRGGLDISRLFLFLFLFSYFSFQYSYFILLYFSIDHCAFILHRVERV